MKDLDALETEFKAKLLAALRQAIRGRSPSLFSLGEVGPKSSALTLRVAAERILELRQAEVTASTTSPAARYLMACLEWQHTHHSSPEAVSLVAHDLLRKVETDAT